MQSALLYSEKCFERIKGFTEIKEVIANIDHAELVNEGKAEVAA